MSFQKISVTDIGYYGKRLTVFEPESVRCLTADRKQSIPQVSHYRVDRLQAEKIQEYFVGTKKRTRVLETVPLKEIYPRIKHVYDGDNVLIARRKTRSQPLRVTGKGMSKFLVLETRMEKYA